MIKSYRDLTVWQNAFSLAVDIHKITKKFPKEELYGLTSQMRRAAFSIPSNIAEGYARHRRLEYIQFLQIAYGSGAELETQALLAKELGILSLEDFSRIEKQLTEVMKMLTTLIDRLKNQS